MIDLGRIGSLRTPIKRALMEMVRFGALERQPAPREDRNKKWRSCNGTVFYDCTAIALVRLGLAVLSVNKNKLGRRYVRLNTAGMTFGRALLEERDWRERAARARTQARNGVDAALMMIAVMPHADDFESAANVYGDECEEAF